MNLIDVLVILILVYCAFMGFRRGFTKELVSFVGVFVIIVFAFLLKNPVSSFMYENFPFFSFGGTVKGITALNIIVYEVLAFLIVVSLVTILFKVLLFATSVFENLLKFTIVLGIPSKILGMFVGIVEGITWSFILLYIFSLPVFETAKQVDTAFTAPLLKNTPFLSAFTKDFTNTIDEFSALKKEYEKKENTEEFNYRTMEVLLKYKIVDPKSVSKLQEKGKLKIKNIEKLLQEYEEE